MNLNSREIRRLNVKSLSNRRCHKRCCRCCLNCLLLLRRRESVCTFDHQSFCSVVLCLGVCLLCTRLSSHLSAVHSVVIACAVYIDYFMVGERVRFLFTSCEESQTNERVFERALMSRIERSYKFCKFYDFSF